MTIAAEQTTKSIGNIYPEMPAKSALPPFLVSCPGKTTVSHCHQIRVRVSDRVRVAVRFGSLSAVPCPQNFYCATYSFYTQSAVPIRKSFSRISYEQKLSATPRCGDVTVPTCQLVQGPLQLANLTETITLTPSPQSGS